ncbi:MAG: hypothetical protein IPI69_00810 [Bacteroidales bacterium]|nr:hypothetical protein [Bacteroidales bacterium]
MTETIKSMPAAKNVELISFLLLIFISCWFLDKAKITKYVKSLRRARGTGHRARGAGRRARGTGHGAQGTGRRAQGTGHGGTGHRARGAGRRARGEERHAACGTRRKTKRGGDKGTEGRRDCKTARPQDRKTKKGRLATAFFTETT